MISSQRQPIDGLNLSLYVAVYEAAGETIHRRLDRPWTGLHNYSRRHVGLVGCCDFNNVETGKPNLVTPGVVWPFPDMDGRHIACAALSAGSSYMCILPADKMALRVVHEEAVFDADQVVAASQCLAVQFHSDGSYKAYVCLAPREIPVLAGDKLVKFWAVPI